MVHKRGQAALEFLSTYGFAFLIILVMIGALTYFGVLSPQKFIPERCLIGSEFSCEDFRIQRIAGDDATVSIVIINQLGNSIYYNMTSANATSQFGNAANPAACTSSSGTTAVVGGNAATVTCTLTGTFPATGEKVKVALDFQYTELGGTFPHPVRAEVLATLQ